MYILLTVKFVLTVHSGRGVCVIQHLTLFLLYISDMLSGKLQDFVQYGVTEASC
jgi:hypothetical protein